MLLHCRFLHPLVRDSVSRVVVSRGNYYPIALYRGVLLVVRGIGDTIRTWARALGVLAVVPLVAHTTGCFSADQPTPVDSGVSLGTEETAKPTLTVAPGAKAVRIIFKNEDPGGSFFISSSDMSKGSTGLPAVRLFNPDNSLLADRRNDINNPVEDDNWPAWFKSFEVTVTGTTSTPNVLSECARFATATEGVTIDCDFADGTATACSSTNCPHACGAPQNVYRVSERDCSYNATNGTSTDTDANGTGGPNDPVQFRVTIERGKDVLESQENLMVVLEYAASSYNGGPQQPTDCFDSSTGKFTLTNPLCTDFTWQTFLKGSASDLVPSFLLLAPPFYGSVDTTRDTGGSGIATRQFIIPLASYPDAEVLQVSRMSGIQSTTPNKTMIQNDCPSNSALCVGMVFYSITFFRI